MFTFSMSANYPLSWFDSMMSESGISSENAIILINHYTSFARAYHNLHHIASMWQIHKTLIVEENKHFAVAEERKLAKAVAYHDVIYDSQSVTNEIDSINSYHHYETGCDQWVDDAILATCNHFARRNIATSDDELREWFIGLDLCRLGSSWDLFMADGLLIRAEYHHLSDEEWNQRRKVFLNKVLALRPIFQHPVFEKHFEDQTIVNVERCLNLLA